MYLITSFDQTARVACPDSPRTYSAVGIWYHAARFAHAAFVSACSISDGSSTSAIVAAAITCANIDLVCSCIPTLSPFLTIYMRVGGRTRTQHSLEEIKSKYATSPPLACLPSQQVCPKWEGAGSHRQIRPHLLGRVCQAVRLLLLLLQLALCQADCTPVKLVHLLLSLLSQIHRRPLLQTYTLHKCKYIQVCQDVGLNSLQVIFLLDHNLLTTMLYMRLSARNPSQQESGKHTCHNSWQSCVSGVDGTKAPAT